MWKYSFWIFSKFVKFFKKRTKIIVVFQNRIHCLFILGEFLASRGRHKEAADLYEKAAELRPLDYELAVAAATAMRQAGRHLEAERWYRKAVLLKPQVIVAKL